MEKSTGVSWSQVLGLILTEIAVSRGRGFFTTDSGPNPCCSGTLGIKLNSNLIAIPGGRYCPISKSNAGNLQAQREGNRVVHYSAPGEWEKVP